MATVDEVDQIRVALMEHAAAFFHDVRTPPEVYARFVLCFNTLRDEMVLANKEGRVSSSMAEAWSWYSLAVPTMLSVIFKDPKWGVRELEQQLNDTFVDLLRKSATTKVNLPPDPAPRPGSAIYTQPQFDPAKTESEH